MIRPEYGLAFTRLCPKEVNKKSLKENTAGKAMAASGYVTHWSAMRTVGTMGDLYGQWIVNKGATVVARNASRAARATTPKVTVIVMFNDCRRRNSPTRNRTTAIWRSSGSNVKLCKGADQRYCVECVCNVNHCEDSY